MSQLPVTMATAILSKQCKYMITKKKLTMQWFNTFNFAYLQVIYNHIDYVSHYFRKI